MLTSLGRQLKQPFPSAVIENWEPEQEVDALSRWLSSTTLMTSSAFKAKLAG
jgi:hypothetical protein